MRILWANAARASLIAGMGGAFMFIGKAFITIGTVVGCYYIYTEMKAYENMSSVVICLAIIFVICVCISVLFMSVYGMAIDSILQCFLFDEEKSK